MRELIRWAPLMLLVGCPGPKDTADTADWGERGDCNPVDPALCALPFPSSFYLEDDPTTVTGRRVALADESLPVSNNNDDFEATWNNEKDGWAIGMTLSLYLGDLSDDGLLSHTDLAAYADDDVTSVILDVTTGERVPHWAERDMTAESDDERLLTLRPAIPLRYDHHYVIGVRDLTLASGEPAAAPEGFAILRDGASTEDPDLARQRRRYDNVIFPALESEGFERDELLMAWELHTASRESMLGRMDHILADALASTEASGLPYTLTEVDDGDCSEDGEHIARTITGTFEAPYYTEADGPNQLLTRDEDGMPYAAGTTDVRFLVRVPCSVAQGGAPAPVLQYGHGLLGDYTEARTGWLAELADEQGWVVLATSWTGMKTEDVPALAVNMTNDPDRIAVLPERLHQGFLEFVLGLRMLQDELAQDDNLTFDGVAVVDTEEAFYYGNSQGGILGGAYMALTPDIQRGVLGVTGMPYSVLLHRSHDFDSWMALLTDAYDDHREVALIMFAMQHLWDAGEPTGWAWDLADDPDKQVLLQVAYGDHQVPTLGAQVQARAYGADLVGTPFREVWGLETQESGFTGSALVEWYYSDADAEPDENLPPSGSADTHECPRREELAQLQIRDFVLDGVVTDYCDGVCEGTVAETCP